MLSRSVICMRIRDFWVSWLMLRKFRVGEISNPRKEKNKPGKENVVTVGE